MTTNVISSVGIIGCGWLGKALAHQLQQQNINVLTTRSNTDNVKALRSEGINAEVLCLPDEQKQLNNHPVFNMQCLVIAITPQFKRGRKDYGDKVEQILLAAKSSEKVDKVILLSSSAVYNGLTGQVNELAELALSADKVTVLNQAEQATLNFGLGDSTRDNASKSKRGCVVRLAGLVGPNRHPGTFLRHGRMLKSPQAKVNLIHQKDAVGIILSLINSPTAYGIFNGVSATHVSKKEYYQTAASALNIQPPSFEAETSSDPQAVRIVCGDKVTNELSYQFAYPDLLAWLSEEN